MHNKIQSMSFRQDFLKARLSKLPAHAPPFPSNGDDNNDNDDEEEELDDFDVNSMPSTSSGFMKSVSLVLCFVYALQCP